MSASAYIIRVNQEEQGPYTFSDLEMYERIGEIVRATPVRRDGHDVWRDWATIKAIHQEEKDRAAKYAQILNPSRAMRGRKKHEVLKVIVGFWVGCSVLGALFGLIAMFTGPFIPGVATLAGSAISAVIFWFIFQALDE